MASAAKDTLEEVKKNIRALLVSSPRGVLLNNVFADYKTVVGALLPFQKLGFASVQELFANIPDTAVLVPSSRGLLVTCVTNESTKHIEHMVRSQKTTSKAKHGPVPMPLPQRRRAGGPAWQQYPASVAALGHPVTYAKPMFHQRVPLMGPAVAMYTGPLYPPYHRPPAGFQARSEPELPNSVQCFVKMVLEKYPGGLSDMAFQERLYSEFSFTLNPNAFGFRNVYEALASIPSVVTLRNTGVQLLIYPAKPRAVMARQEPPTPWDYGTMAPARGARFGPIHPSSRLPQNPSRVNNENAAPGVTKTAVPHAGSKFGPNCLPPSPTRPSPSQPANAEIPPPGLTKNASPEAQKTSMPAGTVVVSAQRTESRAHLSATSGARQQAGAQTPSGPTCTSKLPMPARGYKTTGMQTALCQPNEGIAESGGGDRTAANPESPCRTEHIQADLALMELTNAGHHNDAHIGESMKDVFRRILDTNPNGIWASELIKFYRKHSGHRLDFRELGFYSIHELAVSIPDVFHIKRSKKMGDWLLLPSETSNNDSGMDSHSRQSAELQQSNDRDHAKISISDALTRKMLQVIYSCPNGTVLSDFEILYKRLHNEDFVLNYSDKYYTSEAVFLALPNMFVVEYISETKIVIRATFEGRRFLGHPIEVVEPPRPKAATYPDDAVLTTPKLQKQPLPSDLTQKMYVELYVTYIVNPGQFWIRLRETSAKLDTLMTQLRMLYHNPSLSREYIMPDHLITPNRVCAALFPDDETWYRAIITKIQSEDVVQVCYVDFGNLGNVHRSKLRLLRKQFLTLPFQALMAKLTKVVSAEQASWSESSIRRFMRLCLDKALVALVSNYEGGILSLCLCDTTGEDDIHINTTLVSEGYATFECVLNQPFKTRSAGEVLDNRNGYGQLMGSARSPAPSALPSMTHRAPPGMPWSISMIESARNIRLDEDSLNIIPTCLLNKNFHVVRINGNMYVPSFEVSSLFWKEDVVKEMVRLLSVPVNFLTIEQQARPVVFEKLRHLCTKESQHMTEIALCPLDRMPDILSAIASDRKEWHHAFEDLVKLHKTAK